MMESLEEVGDVLLDNMVLGQEPVHIGQNETIYLQAMVNILYFSFRIFILFFLIFLTKHFHITPTLFLFSFPNPQIPYGQSPCLTSVFDSRSNYCFICHYSGSSGESFEFKCSLDSKEVPIACGYSRL